MELGFKRGGVMMQAATTFYYETLCNQIILNLNLAVQVVRKTSVKVGDIYFI